MDTALTVDLRPAVGSTRALFAAAACSVALLDDAGEGVEFVAADGVGADLIVGTRLPVSRGIVGWVALTGQPIAVAEVESDARFARDVAAATDYIPRVVLAAPLPGPDGDVLGVMELLDPGRGAGETVLGLQRGTAAELSLLTTLGGCVAEMVRLSRERGREGPGPR
ncbi:MAG TPA: GAF domain-containing protein [Marmoricola sp.]|nr:GAF domain-containing protein [Marmoricola sp.]